MDLADLWVAWPVAGPWHLTRLAGGTNNPVWRAETANGQAFVLRLSSEMAGIPRVRYESALLGALSDKQLPFLLPLPLRANSGDIIVPFEGKTGVPAFATLYPLLPGSRPDRNDSIIASKAGFTLALLDAALATLREFQPPKGFQSLPTFGELSNCHPLVPEPLAAVEQLPIDRDESRQLRTILATVIEQVPALYSQLPQQLLHRDYDPGNILVEDQQVTAVLDFEFAGIDIRVLDICVALSWWPVDLMGTGKEWGLIDALGAAYMDHFPLSEEELLAVPAVFRLRDATSLVHRMGRFFAGLETATLIQSRVRFSLWREAWLSANQETLLHHALAWLRNA